MAKSTERKRIQVVAIGAKIGKDTGDVVGYYGHIRKRVGDKFTIYEDEFSGRWMERLTAKESKAVEEEEMDTRPKRGKKQDNANLEESVI